jgi:hypothetical protein
MSCLYIVEVLWLFLARKSGLRKAFACDVLCGDNQVRTGLSTNTGNKNNFNDQSVDMLLLCLNFTCEVVVS